MKIPSQELLDINARAFEVSMRLRSKKIFPDPLGLMELYKPMHFEKTKQGKCKIEKMKGVCFPLTNHRHAWLLGVKSITLNFGKEIEFHKLVTPDGTLTSDSPVEIYSQYISFHHMHGDVLVGGLGLGMAAEMIRQLPRVKSVTVVEKNRDIIRLIKPGLNKDIQVVHTDLFKFLKEGCYGWTFDSAYYDIWYSTGEGSWKENAVPLYRLSQDRNIHTLGAWGEFEMKQQLVTALYSRAFLDETYSEHFHPYWVFVQGLKKFVGKELPLSERHESQVVNLIETYLNEIGTSYWERLFPWDKFRKSRS